MCTTTAAHKPQYPTSARKSADVSHLNNIYAMVETLDFENVDISGDMTQPPRNAPLMRLQHLRIRRVDWQ